MNEAAAQRFGPKQQFGYAAAALALTGVLGGAYAFLARFSTYSMSSSSMEPTLLEGDVVLARGARQTCGSVEPALGDVVVYRKGDTRFIGRTVAGPGQAVSLHEGRVSVDGVRLPAKEIGPWAGGFGKASTIVAETQPNGSRYRTLDRGADGVFDEFRQTRLASGEWLVLGDNRDNALDSRVDGPVPQKNICGVVLRILFSKEAANVGRKP